MSQHLFSPDTELSLTQLDSNFTQLFELRDLISTPAYGAATPRLHIDSAGRVTVPYGPSGASSNAIDGLHFWYDWTAGYCYISARMENVADRPLFINAAYHAYMVGNVRVGGIDGSGNFLWGKIAADATSAGVHIEPGNSIGYGRANFVKAASSGTGNTAALAFYYSGTQVGSVQCSSTATTYSTSSDRRLKQDIGPAGPAGDVIDAIEVVSYRWRSDESQQVRFGVIAQDLHVIVPEAVTAGDGGTEVQDAWGVDYSKLVPLLLAELQSLRRRMATLESGGA